MSTTIERTASNGHSKSGATRLASGALPTDTGGVGSVQIDPIGVEVLRVPLLGETPLIVHRFAEKAKRQMLDAMQGKKTPKQPKDPEADYQGAFYFLPDGSYGFPAIAFKAAIVSASRFYGKDVTMVMLRQSVFTRGERGVDGQMLVRIEGEPQCREDVVTVGMKGHDLRYRPQFTEWAATLEVAYVKSSLTRESIVSLIEAAGMGVGVGEWRPEKNGDFGTFRVNPDIDIEVTS